MFLIETSPKNMPINKETPHKNPTKTNASSTILRMSSMVDLKPWPQLTATLKPPQAYGQGIATQPPVKN